MAEATRSLSPRQIAQRLLKHRAAVATLATLGSARTAKRLTLNALL
jgi:hypothetical protein